MLKNFVNELLSSEKKDVLKEQLRPYINKRQQFGLAENFHGAIIGSYTEENAAQWIAEHEAAMIARKGDSRTPQ